MSLVTRQRGTLTAVALTLFGIQLDFFALTPARPDMARSFAVTAQSARWTLSGPAAGLVRALHDPASAYEATVLVFALLALAAPAVVLLIRHMLVQRGLMKPLSMAADQAGGAAGPGGRPVARGWVSDIPECASFPACDLRHAQCAPGACSSAG